VGHFRKCVWPAWWGRHFSQALAAFNFKVTRLVIDTNYTDLIGEYLSTPTALVGFLKLVGHRVPGLSDAMPSHIYRP
jgi:hypothetical protein